MRLYHRSQDDKVNGIKRCFFDARHGRVSLALMRLQDLDDEFPEDPQVTYAEGLIRIDYLGQGIAARALFERAYQCDNTHAFAAHNATKFARDEQEFRRWAEISLSVAPDDQTFRQIVTRMLNRLDSGVSYWELLAQGSQQSHEAKRFGESAALLELALLAGEMRPDEGVNARRHRAQSLRALDEEAHLYRTALREAFPPEERLALREALTELEKAISLDEYDPELWNLKSAWCSLLGRYEEAIRCADRAIELRPSHYPKPHQKKANALWGLEGYKEALECAEEALRQAESSRSAEDLTQARKIIEAYSTPPRTPGLGDMEPVIVHIVNAAQTTSDEEIGQWRGSIEGLVGGVLTRAGLVRGDRSMEYVPIMAELLSDFTPETVFRIILGTAEKDQGVYEHCLHAALYVAACSEGVRQRDAARYLVLAIFGALEGPTIRNVYRQAILEPSASARGEMSRLDAIMRQELGRINPLFPRLIADQEPVDEAGRERAARTILSRFSDMPSQSMYSY